MTVRRRWDVRAPRGGTAVVIDVLRFSTTLCALLKAGRKEVWVADTPRSLPKARRPADADAFSELDFSWTGRKFDNSPALALAAGRSDRAAYVTSTSGSRALWASRRADLVLVGGFANFSAVLERLRRAPGRVSFVPAAPPIRPSAIEDELCARAFVAALAGRRDSPARALDRLRDSPRIGEFMGLRLGTGEEDLAYCTRLDGMPIVPEAVFAPPSLEGGFPFARIRRAS